MKISAIENQGYTPHRNSNGNQIAFQGFDVSLVKKDIINCLYYANVKTIDEANEMIKEAEEEMKTLQHFDEAKFNLHDYEDSFTGYKRTAFDEFVKELGSTANDLPIKIDNTYGLRGKDMYFKYEFPENCKIEYISHSDNRLGTLSDRLSDCVKAIINGKEESISYKYNELMSSQKYFSFYPKSVDAVKKFIIDCIDGFVLTPRAKELEAQDALKLAQALAERLKGYANTLKV